MCLLRYEVKSWTKRSTRRFLLEQTYQFGGNKKKGKARERIYITVKMQNEIAHFTLTLSHQTVRLRGGK